LPQDQTERDDGGTATRRLLSGLPAVDRVLRHPALAEARGQLRPEILARLVRETLDEARQAILSGRATAAPDSAKMAEGVVIRAGELLEGRKRRVINASGVVLHTGLGRAMLPERAVARVAGVMSGAVDLELRLSDGRRGRREEQAARLLTLLTGAEAALAVNNNAAAVHLMLRALCARREVLVSRGQQVEIGGGFRIPEVIRQSGARLVEVGCTNRTRLADYEEALTPRTAAILRVHPSNYRVTGFTEEPSLAELAGLAHARGLLLLDDLGSGALVDFPGVPGPEPLPQASLAAGADLVCFSGDKLLGGPQAGLLLGRATLVEKLARHPMMRAFRCDKLTLAALEAVLELYLEPGGEAPAALPVWAACNEPREAARQRVRSLFDSLLKAMGRTAEAGAPWGRRVAIDGCAVLEELDSEGRTGSGALPEQDLPSAALRVRPLRQSADRLGRRLRGSRPVAVVGQVKEGALLLDLKAVRPHEIQELAAILAAALGED
jgi:L-seryl-tRNA(Ser) seleniumtransferase